MFALALLPRTVVASCYDALRPHVIPGIYVDPTHHRSYYECCIPLQAILEDSFRCDNDDIARFFSPRIGVCSFHHPYRNEWIPACVQIPEAFSPSEAFVGPLEASGE
jgi:hypothetical protein